ncbi:MAG: hypothetical protein LBU65_12345 [Planctomycetaceae bacterium]|nr:hypothetical protein [Planctomycetaceae bacterium]
MKSINSLTKTKRCVRLITRINNICTITRPILERLIEKGLAEGEAKGKAEIALTMKSKGFKLSDIANITGLSASEIERLS